MHLNLRAYPVYLDWFGFETGLLKRYSINSNDLFPVIMCAFYAEKQDDNEFDKEIYLKQLPELINPALSQFQKKIRSYSLFNSVFIFLILLEVVYFVLHLSFLSQSFVLAFHLALIFATVFSYFTLKVYFYSHKKEALKRLKNCFVQSCQSRLREEEGMPDYHCLVAEACCTLASSLYGMEYRMIRIPFFPKVLESALEALSCRIHWHDVHVMKELLLQACVEEYIKLVRLYPTDLEAHAGLANAYVMLSGLYVDPRTVEGLDDERWIPPQKFNEEFKQKFRSTAERAIEEFRILSDYAPDDPWVHAQLAYSYHDLQMPLEEIKEYETILRLCPDDKETLYKLGKLYFDQGQNAKGLEVYENLKQSNYKKAEDLIHFYGAYSTG